MANITKRTGKNGAVSYRFRVYAGQKADGSMIYKSHTWAVPAGMSEAKAEKEATKKAAEFEKKVQQGVVFDTKMTLDEFLDKWFKEYARPQLKPKTVYGYEGMRPRVSQALGHLRLDKIRPTHLMAFYQNLGEEGMRGDIRYTATAALCKELDKYSRKEVAQKANVGDDTLRLAMEGHTVSYSTAQKLIAFSGLAPTKAFRTVDEKRKLSGNTVYHYHRFLSTVFSTAVKWQMLPENPCSRVAAPKVETPDTEFMDESQVAALLVALDDAPPQYKAITQLALLTGCRRGEICGLRWSDVDFEHSTLSINRNLQDIPGQGAVFGTPKTKRSRRCIKISEHALQIFVEWHKVQLEERLKVGSLWAKTVEIDGKRVKNDLVFTRWNGEPIDAGEVSSWFPKFLREHDLPPVRFHSLRHTNASLLIAAHVPITTVSGRLGHAKTSTTTDIYAACIRSSDAAAADALDDVFTNIQSGQKLSG